MKGYSLKPFVKWAGGKRQLVGEITSRFPEGFGVGIKRYAEPFVGGGAVLFAVLEKYDVDEVYISDVNAELINVYREIKEDADGVIDALNSLSDEYIPLDEGGRKACYYKRRDEFNAMIQSGESRSGVRAAALFVFLNRTCFNGLYRVNGKGLLNVPAGVYKNPLICDEDNLRAVSEALRKVTIVCGDYRMSDDFIDSDTLVYFDPPYRPLTATASFTSYTDGGFDDDAQRALAGYFRKLSEKGAYVMLSNSDPKNENPDDDFFDELYKDFRIERIHAIRAINSNGGGRGKISELLIRNY